MAVARDALAAAVAVLRPGVAEIELKAAFEAGMAAHGVTTPSVEGTFNSVFPGPGALAKGELVPDACRRRRRRLGGDGRGDLRVRDAARGAPRLAGRGARAVPPGRAPWATCATRRGVTVDGVGMGHEELADDDVLEAGMALAIEREAADVLTGATVVVTDDGYEVL